MLSCLFLCSLQPCAVVTCWNRDDPLALLCVVFSCIFVTFPIGGPGQVWYLIVPIPDLCLPLCFTHNAWVKVFSIITEFRILMLIVCDKSA